MRLARRELFLSAAAAASVMLPTGAWGDAAQAPSLDAIDLTLAGDPRLARRCLLLVPRGEPVRRLLVLCHGLGETYQELMGIHAWSERYGLVRAYERLMHPPLVRESKEIGYLSDERRAALNSDLSLAPFRGLCVACPFTPNVYAAASTDIALERYARWIDEVLLPELRSRLGLPASASIALDGVSLGGYVSLEVFLRRPNSFSAVGSVQGAFGASLAEAYAVRFDKVFQKLGARPVRIATSERDPFRGASERLAKRLLALGVTVDFSVEPGPHDQVWLQEVGSLELLRHYDRTLT